MLSLSFFPFHLQAAEERHVIPCGFTLAHPGETDHQLVLDHHLPEAFEYGSVAAARFRRPEVAPPPRPSSARPYSRIGVPTLVVEGSCDKLLPSGWAAQIAGQIPGASSVVIPDAGHCPQIEKPWVVNELLLEFLAGARGGAGETDVSQAITRSSSA